MNKVSVESKKHFTFKVKAKDGTDFTFSAIADNEEHARKIIINYLQEVVETLKQ